MKSSARLSAVIEILDQWQADPGPVEHRIRNYFRTRRYAGSKDRRWVTEFLFSFFRKKGEISWLAEGADLGDSNRLVCCLALMLNEGLTREDLEAEFLEGPHAQTALSDEEKLALEKAMATPAAGKPDWVAGNFPEWLVTMLEEQFGDETNDLMAIFQERSPLTLRVNTVKTDVGRVAELLAADDIKSVETDLSPMGLTLSENIRLQQHEVFEKGLIEIQDEAAQIAALLTDAHDGQTVVDYCAGAGGKSLAIASQMSNQGRIIALDINARRMKDIAVRRRRAEVDIIETVQLLQNDQDEDIFNRLGKVADRVFVDAPCSGSGTWRRQPDQKWAFSADKLDDLVSVQKDVLEQARRLVAPGGRLIYATCSIFEQENDNQVSAFLDRNPDFEVMPVSDIWKDVGLKKSYDGQYLKLRPISGGHDGFFAAVLVRKSEE